MESKSDINIRKGINVEKSKSMNLTNIKLSIPNIYIISCINNLIWEKELYILQSTNFEVISIENIYKSFLFYDKKFDIIIHKINLKEKLKKLNLILFSETFNKIIHLKEIRLNPDFDMILFSDIDINQKDLNNLMKDNKEEKYIRLLTVSEKLKIYYEYFSYKNEIGMTKLKSNLAMQYLYNCEKDEIIRYSDIIMVFCLAFGQKIITNFLDTYIKFNIEFDTIKIKNFEEILNLYNLDIKKFFERNRKHFGKKANEYQIALENFITLYKLFNNAFEEIPKQQLKNVKGTLIKLINNKRDIIKRNYFIFHYFDMISLVLYNSNTDNQELFKIVFKSKDDFIDFNFEVFKAVYQEIINLEEDKNKYFLDFSDIFNVLVDINDNAEIIIDIKKIYKKELKKIPNPKLKDKINDKIHKTGIQKILKGKYNNKFLMRFLKYDCSEKNQNFDLLIYFKIELMDDNFFKYFNEEKIYSFFESNLSLYLNKFAMNIKDMKYFGIFFKILPPEKYDSNSIAFLFNWLKQYIHTLDFDKCKNFKEELFIFFNILINNKLYNYISSLIKFIKDNIKAYFVDICISLLNQKNINVNNEIIKNIISNLIFFDEDYGTDLDIEKVKIFLEKVDANKQVIKIFFSKLEYFSLKYDDFFDEYNTRLIIFELLLNCKKINIFGEYTRTSTYCQNTKNTCESLINELEKLNIYFNQILISLKNLGNEKMLKRFLYIYLFAKETNYEDNSNKIFNKISQLVNNWEDKIKKIELMKEYNIFISKQNENINEINNNLSEYIKKILFTYKLAYLDSPQSLKEFNSYIDMKTFKLVEKVLQLRDSNVFLEIFDKIKKKEKKNIAEKTIKEFEKLKNLFINNEQKIIKELKSNDSFKYLIEICSKNEALLIQEIDWMINYFQINNFNHKDFLIEKIKIYINYQSLFEVLSGLFEFFDIFKDIFEVRIENDINLEKQISEFVNKNKSNDMVSIEQFERISKYLEQELKISNYSKDIFDNFFIQVYKKSSFIKFIKNKKTEHVNHLKEFLLEYEESELKEEDVNDFIIVVQFFEKQISNIINNKLSFCNLVENIMTELSRNKNIEKSLFNYIKIYNHIEILLNKYLKGSDEWIKKLKSFYEYSDFFIKLEKNEFSPIEKYNVSGVYKDIYSEENNEENNKFCVSLPYFFQKDLDSIFQKIYITKIPDIYKDIINSFVSFYKNIKQLINILDELYINGYHKKFNITIFIRNTIITSKINDKDENLSTIVKNLFTLNYVISEKIIKLYEENQCVRFFYPRQLVDIYNNIIINNSNDKNKEKTKTMMNIYFNNVFQKLHVFNEINGFEFEEDYIREYCEVIQKIDKYICDQLELNKTTLQNIYEINKIKLNEKPLHSKNSVKGQIPRNKSFEGIFFRIPKNNNQEIEALNIYAYMTYTLPINNCFFYCSRNTFYEELKYFLLRSFLCEYQVLFCIINIDLLNYKLRRAFINLVKKYYKKYRKSIKSCLLLMFDGKEDELHNMILKIKNIKVLPEYIATSRIFEFDQNYKISLINSKYCGYGKSEYVWKEKGEIVNKKSKEKDIYIYFPIGGKFNKNKFSERIDKLPDMSNISKNYVIHFDITQTKEIEFLNEFFFKLIILRKYDINSIKYFGKNIELIIEIPNDFTDYIKEIKIFNRLNKTTLSDIPELNYSDDLLFVSKILTLYENDDILKPQVEVRKAFSKLNLSLNKCQSIINKYLTNNNLNNLNYYQLNIFIKILSEEFHKFYNCEAYNSEILIHNAVSAYYDQKDIDKVKNLRKFIINSLIKITNLFILSPYESLIKNQELNQKILDESEEKKEKNINKELEINIDSFSFDNIHPSLIVFNEDGGSSTIIATCNNKEEEFINLEKLYNSQTKEKLKNFRDLTGEEIFEKLLEFLNVSQYFRTKEEKNKILGTYVYTPDNFIKVILILMRIRVNIPVILMGETGCGKTKLIEMASQLINKGEIKIKKLNIHAGIQDDDIIRFIERLDIRTKKDDDILYEKKVKEFEKLPEETKNAYYKRNSKKEIYAGFKEEIDKRKIWIFLDEINTCHSMGLLTEIMCKKSIYGRPLDKRYAFIAACNPYRVSKKENFLLNVLYKKNQKKKSLVYTVNPLPMSLMNFVFNFGSLKPNDELAYIRSMVEKTVDKFLLEQKNSKIKKNWVEIETNCVKLCQDFVKKNNDASIVSLREVNRFNIFLEFFINYLLERKHNKRVIENDIELDEIYNFYSNKNESEIFYFSLNLSLYICYYLRLPNKESRQELTLLINSKKYLSYDFLKIPEMELNYLIKHFTIPEGIAKNKNLKENIFLLFFCIINKIPLIICGKPGRSKTLSFKILQNSMKGPLSSNSFCQKYPELLSFKIQGSLNTTSEEIIKIFQRGRTNQKNNKDKLWVIFMDEMGLAEISDNNPLKVMHAELEQEKNKIAFVGISNWFIDASKMNRVIYNVVQDPDEDDIIETGKEIAKSYQNKGKNIYQKFENIIIKLSKAYYKFINKKKNENDKNQYFHGSRDFYSLIRSVMKDVIMNSKKLNELNLEQKNYLLNKICIKQIMRNFGGLENSVNDFKQYFFEEYENINYIKEVEFKYNVMECLKENLNDENSRYLLLITESNLSQELLNYILEDICQDKNNQNKIENQIYTKYFFGSIFKSDKNNISYSNEILSKIKYQMGTNNILVLKDLESVYPSLYELFNQSYTYLDGKKFVHLGESQSLTLVHDNFKVIVLINKKQIEEQEPPFLNRFEKHIINYTNLLSENLLKISKDIFIALNQINSSIDEFIKLESNNSDTVVKNIKLKLEKFINFIKEEEIKGLVYIASIKLKEIKDDDVKYRLLIIKYVFSKLVPFFSEELMILITKYGWKNRYKIYYDIIYQIYKENYNYNLKNYIENLENDVSIIYTYSSILEENKIFENGVKDKYGIVHWEKNVKEVNISEINSKEQIEKEIVDFIFSDLVFDKKNENNLLILKFREEELNKLNNIYYLLNEYNNRLTEKNIENIKKYILFIIYLKKDEKIKNHNSISFISNCPQKMIENLYNNHENFPQVLISSNEEIIKNNLFDINYAIINCINDIFRYFDFNIINRSEKEYFNFPFIYQLLEYATKSDNLKKIFLNCLYKLIEKEEDFIKKIFKKEICQKESLINTDFSKSLFEYILDLFFNNFRKIIIILEKEQIMFSVLFNDKLFQKEIIKKYVDIYISQINSQENKDFQWDDKIVNKKYVISLLYGNQLPFMENIFNNIMNYVSKNISTQFLEEDTYFFYKIISSEKIHERQEKYMKNLKKFNNKLSLEVNKHGIVLDILKSKDKILIEAFFHDLLFTFIKKNTQLKTEYSELSKILDLIIQIRLITRKNDILSMEELDNNIEFSSFIEIIEEEIKEKNKNIINNEEELIDVEKTKENVYINKFLSIIIFLQSYAKDISLILEIYYFLFEHFPKIYDDITSIIKNKGVCMEKSERNNDYNQVNKACFYYIIESMCKILNQKICILFTEENNNDNLKNESYLNHAQYFIHNLLKLEKKFMLFSNEIFLLDIIIKIIEKVKISSTHKEKIDGLIICLGDIFSEIENKSELITNLYIILTQILEQKPDEFSLLMNNILLNIYNSNQNIREYLIKNILLNSVLTHNSKLLEHSFPLFNRIFQFDSIKLINSSKEPNFFQSLENSSELKKLFEESLNDIEQHDMISDILIYGFEIFFDNYFKHIIKENIDNNNDYLKKYLKESTDFYYVKNEANNKKYKLRFICKLFSIAYIKSYINYLVDILTNDEKYNNFYIKKEILQILFSYENNQKKCIIFYFLKLIWKKYNNWEDLIKFYYKDEEIKKYFDKIIDLTENKFLFCTPNLLIYDSERDNYDYNYLLFQSELNINNNKNKFDNIFMIDNNFEYLYTFLSNVMIIYYSCKENTDKKRDCKNLMVSILKYLNEHENLKGKNDILNFINMFFDMNNFESIKELIMFNKDDNEMRNDIIKQKITILYNALRFIFSLIVNINNNKEKGKGFYINLLSKKIVSELDKNYIPGTFPNDNIKIQSFYKEKQIVKNNPKKYGAFICSCGCINSYKYSAHEYQCNSCHKKYEDLNNTSLSLIFFDTQIREEMLNKKNININIQNKLLYELEIEIEQEKQIFQKGLKPVNFETFLKNEETVRKMKDITYRFLNFLLYSFIFYGYKIGNIEDKNINKYLIANMTPFEIIEINWKMIGGIVGKNNVEIFFNLIFEDIMQNIVNTPDFKIKGKTGDFEKEIDDVIINLIGEKDKINNYKEKNERILNIKPDSSKVIIQEIFPYNKYDKKIFPDFKYFYLSELPSKEDFINKFNSRENNKEDYPIINMILNDQEIQQKAKLMKYLPKINELCNYIINFVSFRYSREEAKKILIEQEINDDKINLLKEFIPIYNELRFYMRQKLGNAYSKMELNELKLSDLCIDSEEEGFGFNIYLIYKEMIEWQNNFINTIINSGKQKLQIYKELFELKIMIQDCEEDQILYLPQLDDYLKSNDNNIDILDNKNKFNLLKIIFDNSYRKENKVIYNFNEIENALISNILHRIKSFKSEIRKVVYQYEFNIGDRSKIIMDFMKKYKQRELNEYELEAVFITLLRNKINEIYDIKNILFSLNILIDIISDKSPNINESLFTIISTTKTIAISDMVKNFFETIMINIKNKSENNLTISCLINLMEIIELFLWESIKNNLEVNYKEDINDKIKNHFTNNKFLSQDNNKLELCSALRKLISRYLSTKIGKNIYKNNKNLKEILLNEELWPFNANYIENKVNKIFGNIEVKASQALKLYQFLGGDENKFNELVDKYNNNIKKDKDNIEIDEDKEEVSNSLGEEEKENESSSERSDDNKDEYGDEDEDKNDSDSNE